MPIYEYQCTGCAARKEFLLKVGSEPENVVCSWCGGTLQRVPSAPAVHFKGSGWTEPTHRRENATEEGEP